MLRDFDEDPFFTDTFSVHRDHMHQMMRSFSEPFGRDPFLSIMDGRERSRSQRRSQDSQVALRDDHRSMSLVDPFRAVDNIFSDMRNRMLNIHQNIDSSSASPAVHSFASSSVMTYSKVGNEPPKVFQATSQTRCAPGGLKETRKSVRDSESGVEKMAVGHHIKDRAHVIEKSQNRKTGDQEERQDLVNLDEDEAQSFNEQWEREISKLVPSTSRLRLNAAPKPRQTHHAAVLSSEDAAMRERHRPKAPVDSRRPPELCRENFDVKGVPMKANKK